MASAGAAAQDMQDLVDMLTRRLDNAKLGKEGDRYKVEEVSRKVVMTTEMIGTSEELLSKKKKLLTRLNNEWDTYDQQIKSLSRTAGKMTVALERLNGKDAGGNITMS